MYDRNKPYNNLPELPPTREYLDSEVLMAWGMASRELGILKKNVYRIPNAYMLINTISLQEARTSSEIENIFTTNDELYKAISQDHKEESAIPAVKEVLSYREALWKGYQSMKSKLKLSDETLISVFQQVKSTTQQFRPPQSQTIIRRGNSELRAGEVIYTPPRGEGIIEQKIENLLDFLNDKQNGIDPLLKMAIGHYQFEAIHPFTDGNGRTGRIINLLYLVQQDLISHPILYLSRYIIQTKETYYHLLSGVTQRGDWKPWMKYMMNAVEQTSRLTNSMIDQIIAQQQGTLEYAQDKRLKWYTKEFNEFLFSQPYIKPYKIGEILDVTSRTTITKYASDLVRLGIVSAKHDGKEVYYINDDLMRILA